MFDAVAFAGGGNRCYWQGGFWLAAAGPLAFAPRLVVGASAGAWQATYSLLGLGGTVPARVIAACGAGIPNLDWRGRHGLGRFPVARMYRALVAETVDAAALDRLNALTDLRIAIAHPPTWLPTGLAAAIGLVGYQIEKRLFHPVHPRFGRVLGFAPAFPSARELATPAAFVDAVMASATVRPIMPAIRIGERPALDGGFVDNVPVDPLAAIEADGGRTLVLLTRRYRDLPRVRGRTYVQPSRPLTVKQFDVTDPDGIRDAFELGRADGAAFVRAMR